MQNRIRSKLPAWAPAVVLVPFTGVLMLASCSSPDVEPPAPPKPCVAGELTLPDGRCQPAGLPLDRKCEPGEVTLDDGTCQLAGVPPTACGQGFAPNGKQGCEPILPADECPFGTMAIPGETACHEVAPCGNGTWGDIPVEANTQFVNQAYVGNDSDGTKSKPWKTIQQGVDKSSQGAIVAVAGGTYAENVTITGKPIRLWGRCPEMVMISGADQATIRVLGLQSSGAEVRNVGVTGTNVGIFVSAATDVEINSTWIHDAARYGLQIDDTSGPTKVTVNGSLLEQNHEFGVFVFGSDMVIEGSVVRKTLANLQGKLGRGIEIENDPATMMRSNVIVRNSVVEQNRAVGLLVAGSDAIFDATVVRKTLSTDLGLGGYGIEVVENSATKSRANVTVRGSLVEKNHDVGVFVRGSDATIETTVVRDTVANAQGNLGHGVHIQDEFTKSRANVIIRSSVVEDNHEVGVSIAGSDATLEATVVRATQPNAVGNFGQGINMGISSSGANSTATIRGCIIEQNHNFGVGTFGASATIEDTIVRGTFPNAQDTSGTGIAIQNDKPTKSPGDVTVRGSLIEENHNVGVLVWGAKATIESSVVRGTLRDANGNFGRGIGVQDDTTTKMRADVTICSCLVEQNNDVGLVVFGSDATIEASAIRTTMPNMLERLGYGIAIQFNPTTTSRADVTLHNCLVEQNHETGVFIHNSEATINASVVRETAPRPDNLFGDGISVDHGNAKILDTEVSHNVRAGVANFSSRVRITGGAFFCNGFNIEGEVVGDTPFTFEGTSGWRCGARTVAKCTELDNTCFVQTTGIAPPPPLSASTSSMP